MNTRQIFGRQPVVIVAAVQVVLQLLVSFHALKGLGLNGQDDVALVVGVLNAAAAVYLVLGTTESALAAVIELFKAILSFGAIYQLHLNSEQTGLAITAITVFFALVHQPKTSPQATLSITPGAVLVAPESATPVIPVTATPEPPAVEVDQR